MESVDNFIDKKLRFYHMQKINMVSNEKNNRIPKQPNRKPKRQN